MTPEAASTTSTPRRRSLYGWLIGLTLLSVYMLLPGHDADNAVQSADASDEDDADPYRTDVVDVSPRDPYVGNSIAIVYSGPADASSLHAYAGKTELRVLSRRPNQLLAQLPPEIDAGDVKVRVASGEALPFGQRAVHGKAFRIRVREPNLRKVFRQLVGGAGLIVLGIGLLARGARGTLGLGAARRLALTFRRQEFSLGAGALLGVFTQSAAGAASVLSALVTSRMLPLLAAALAFMGATLGAGLSPLLLAGFVEPNEGLLAVAFGVSVRLFAADRRVHALSRLLIGVGLLTYGVQVLRPGLEPFLSNAALLSITERMRAASLVDLALCTVLGSLLVAGLQGPGPLVMLLLGVAQTTGRWDLRVALALLAGSAFGSALAALIPAAASGRARALTRLHLVLGLLGSLIAFFSVDLWVSLARQLFGEIELPLHLKERLPQEELGLQLALCFGLSQLAASILPLPIAPWLARRFEPRSEPLDRAEGYEAGAAPEVVRARLGKILARSKAALASAAKLARSGERKYGQVAEQQLREAESELLSLLRGPVLALPNNPSDAFLTEAAYTTLQVQHALQNLLSRAERMVEAGLESALDPADAPGASAPDRDLLDALERLLTEGLDQVHARLVSHSPLDLEAARAREIEMNRLEKEARRSLSERRGPPRPGQVALLQLVDAYEASGNQVYRLSELLGEELQIPRLRLL